MYSVNESALALNIKRSYKSQHGADTAFNCVARNELRTFKSTFSGLTSSLIYVNSVKRVPCGILEHTCSK